ncbi:MAG TPA: mechanosensitive ion channel domain-containing protein [Lacunisphaera sp.]|nr:mechanosensitive ion channel domain-containing protein [Lacunisphaera sp.]
MTYSNLIERINAYLPQLMAALPVALAVVVGTYILNVLVGRALLVVARRTNLTEMDVLPVRHVFRWLTRLVAVVLILSVFGFQIGGIWAVLSTIFGLVAIGFVAVWSVISHTSATMLILVLRPFQMGDDLEFPGEPIRGRAIDLNFFFTTLIDHEGQLFQIPNNLFFQKTVKRRRNHRLVSLAAQLNSPRPLEVELPPAPPAPAAANKPADPDPLMKAPDPKSFMPQDRRGKD